MPICVAIGGVDVSGHGLAAAADAATADEKLAEAAQSKTFGELRSAAHRPAPI